jgi:periplasmic protein TonB
MQRFIASRHTTLVAVAVAALLAACGAPKPAPQEAAPPPVVAAPKAAPQETYSHASLAASAKAYRKDAASHIYALNSSRIYKGRMPPLLYAVGVLQVDIDQRGQVQNVSWMRAPRHAPEVMAEIEKMVRAGAPYPAPAKLGGHVTYTDTWLWHKSGRFQLDTLTEGQD